jgi:hypothetical protein
MAVFYFLAEEPLRNGQRQDCCLIVEVHVPDWIQNDLVRLAAQEAIDQAFGRRLALWPADEDEASQYLQSDADAALRGSLKLGTGDPLLWHLLPLDIGRE